MEEEYKGEIGERITRRNAAAERGGAVLEVFGVRLGWVGVRTATACIRCAFSPRPVLHRPRPCSCLSNPCGHLATTQSSEFSLRGRAAPATAVTAPGALLCAAPSPLHAALGAPHRTTPLRAGRRTASLLCRAVSAPTVNVAPNDVIAGDCISDRMKRARRLDGTRACLVQPASV